MGGENMSKKCSVYVRNAECGPACYYRVIQYLEELDLKDSILINNALDKKEFNANLNLSLIHI